MSDDVVVVALGARTPLGLSAETSAAAVRAGIARIQEHPFMVAPTREPLRVAVDGRLDAKLLGWERLVPLATTAFSEVAGKALGRARVQLPVLLSLPERRPGFEPAEEQKTTRAIRDALSATGLMDRLELAGSGHAGVLQGIAAAAEHLRARRQSLCAVGGVDSYLDVYTIAALASQRRIAVEGVRGGFHPGEGAGFLVLALASTARQLGLPSLAKVRGAFADTEERSILNGGEPLGHGLVAAIAGAAGGLRLPGETVDAVFCDINGERYRSEEWAMAILRAPHLFAGSGYEAPANLWGDVGAAWGALGCVLAVRSWAREYAKGPRALVWGSSDAGLRAAAVLERGDNAGEAPWPR